jgi:hypothetical protein
MEEYTYRHTDLLFMNYAVEMDLGATIIIPSLIKIGSGIGKLMGMGGSQTHIHTDSMVIS